MDRQVGLNFILVDDGNIQNMTDLSTLIGFQWDAGNDHKNNKHGVSTAEAEQVFFNAPLLLMDDVPHSQVEARFHALGQTNDRRLLHIMLSLRKSGQLIRVISARDMHRKERSVYEQADR